MKHPSLLCQNSPLSSKVQAVGAFVPEGHADAGDGVNHVEAADGLGVSRLPEGNLALAHLGEARGGEAVVLAHPDGSAVLGAMVTLVLVDGLLLADIPDADLLVARRGDEEVAAGVPAQALDNVRVAQRQGSLAGGDVPELDCEVARGRSQDVFGGGVEEDVADLSVVAKEALAIGFHC